MSVHSTSTFLAKILKHMEKCESVQIVLIMTTTLCVIDECPQDM